jgi:crossover junction endodeoxyribonuclease RuvC
MNYVLGVDPGLSGGLALVEIKTKELIGVWDMPLTTKNGHRLIDVYELGKIIDFYSKEIRFAVIEEVGVMTGKEGRVSMFNFGKSAGVVDGILGVCAIPMFFVRPAVWKNLMGLGSNKKDSLCLASKLFPRDAHNWARRKDDGRAEAVLLSLFGVERFV